MREGKMNDTHTNRSYDEALNGLSDQIRTMGADVSSMLEDAVTAFRNHDVDGAKRLVERDLIVDRQHDDIRAAVVDILARLQPVARDLREVLVAERIAANLERIADHAKSIGKRSIAGAASASSRSTASILDRLQAGVVQALHDILRALKERDAVLADQVRHTDTVLDQLYDDLFHAAVASLRSSSDTTLGEVDALFVGKSLERIGDHATNIAEEIRFMMKGDLPRATREV
jgi:phosphate transport system protein